MKDNRSFLFDALIYGIGGVLMQIGGFILLPLYTHYLSPGDYGTLEIIERIGRVINICLMAGGIRQATLAIYLQTEDEEQKLRVAASVTLFIVLIFCTASTSIYFLSDLLVNYMQIDSAWMLIFGVITVVSELFMVVPMVLMQARIESIAFVSVNIGMLVVRITLALIFIVSLDLGLWGAYLAQFITFICFGIVLTLREMIEGSFKILWPQCKEVARFSVPFIPTGIFLFAMYNGDRFFLLGSSGKEAVGIYSLGCKLAEYVGVISSGPLYKIWSAKLYQSFKSVNASHVVGRNLTKILLCYSFVGVILCVFYREILMWFCGSNYLDAGKIIPLIVLANAFLFASTFMEGALYVFRRTALKPWTAAGGAIITLGLYSVLIPHYSIYGAAYATLIGYIFMSVITYSITRRVFTVNYELKRLTLLIIISVSIYFLASILPVSTTNFLIKCILIVSWFILTWFCGVVSQQNKEEINFHLNLLLTQTILKIKSSK